MPDLPRRRVRRRVPQQQHYKCHQVMLSCRRKRLERLNLVVGAVEGNFKSLFSKLTTLHAKNNFTCAIVAGDFFRESDDPADSDASKDLEDLVQNRISIPFTTYFTLGRRALPTSVASRLEANGNELCPNLYFLGKRSTTKTSDGIRIVALGGSFNAQSDASTPGDTSSSSISAADANVLKGAHTADILVTSVWPEGICDGSQVDFETTSGTKPPSDRSVADLCATIKPRYHFSTSHISYEREAFFHAPTKTTPNAPTDPGYRITRFISLADFGNTRKQKAIYAFTLDLTAPAPAAIPAGTTASPFAHIVKKRPHPDGEHFSRFSQDTSHQYSRGANGKRQRGPPPSPSECFFCLSNPTLATHLVVSIGTESYLTTSKGPLSTSTTFSTLDFPAHILIIPIPHNPTLAAISPHATRAATIAEMQKYRASLNSMLAAKSDGALGSVSWEVSRGNGVHAHWQYMPMSAASISKGLVEAAFKVEAENLQYPAMTRSDVADGDEAGDCFNVWIWNPAAPRTGATDGSPDAAGQSSKLSLELDASFRFDLQMGRRVLAKLLGLEHRTHWRDCDQSEQEETGDADRFKAAFKSFDFNL